ncbi:hypothetical protein PO909_024408 [Leuciscus waleckii]
MRYYLIILFLSTIVCFSDVSSNVDVVQEDVKVVRAGEDVNLTCSFSTVSAFCFCNQQKHGLNRRLMEESYKLSLYLNQQPSWNKDFEKMSRFNVFKGDDHFNLFILQTKPSDSSTYYCHCIIFQHWNGCRH